MATKPRGKHIERRERLRRIHEVIDFGTNLLAQERELIRLLYAFDQDRLFVVVGDNSLKGFCTRVLGLTRTQAQRIVTQVRRYEPTVNFREVNPP